MSPVPLQVASPPVGSVSQSPHLTFFLISAPYDDVLCKGGPKYKMYPLRSRTSYIGESRPGVAAQSRSTTSSILYLVANQIKDGGVVVSSPIPSPCCRVHVVAMVTPLLGMFHLPTCTILSLTQPTISCREREKHGTFNGYKVTGVSEAHHHHGLSRASLSPVPCSVANRALSTPCRI